MLVLDQDTIIAYLASRGLLPDPSAATVEPLSGGYINQVFRVSAGGKDYVVKQSLEQSDRTVLRADIRRGLMEVEVMRAIKEVLGPGSPTPTVIDADPRNYICVMSAAPRDSVLYHDELISGRFHERVAALVGEYAGKLHSATAGNEEIARSFRENPGFELRDRTIRSAIPANPDLAVRIQDALTRNLENAEALVDFDITPKNVLVHAQGITKLDFECAQYGDPAFDVGVALAHFALLAFARSQWKDAFLLEARSCFEAYSDERPMARTAGFMERVTEYLALMMLGRVDGDLVFEYLVPHRPAINELVRVLLGAQIQDLDALIDSIGRGIEAEGRIDPAVGSTQ